MRCSRTVLQYPRSTSATGFVSRLQVPSASLQCSQLQRRLPSSAPRSNALLGSPCFAAGRSLSCKTGSTAGDKVSAGASTMALLQQRQEPTSSRAHSPAGSPSSSRIGAYRRCERNVPAAASEEPPMDHSAQSWSSSSRSLQVRLGISDRVAENIRRKGKTTKKGFENLTTTSSDVSGDGRGRCRSGSISSGAPGNAETLSSLSSLQPSSYSCFPTFLLDDLRAKPAEVKSLVLRRPVVLAWSAGAAEKMSLWLQGKLGMRRSEVAQLMLRNPEAGTKAVESMEVKVDWLRENLDLGGEDFRGVIKVLLHAPQLFNLSIERSLEPMLRWLKDRLGVSREEAAKLARENPTLFWLSVEANLELTLEWLRNRLEVEEKVILQIVAVAPKILALNTNTGLEPKLAWLRDRVGLNQLEICKIISSEPTILYKSVADNLEPTLAWLEEHLGLDDEAARQILVAFPRLVSTSLDENLKLKIPWLQQALGLSPRDAVALAKRAPALLQYSIEDNLEPKLSFFREEMHASEEELRIAVVRNPKFLAYSLEGRLRPRVAAMRVAKIEPMFSKHKNHVGRWADTKFQAFVEQHRR